MFYCVEKTLCFLKELFYRDLSCLLLFNLGLIYNHEVMPTASRKAHNLLFRSWLALEASASCTTCTYMPVSTAESISINHFFDTVQKLLLLTVYGCSQEDFLVTIFYLCISNKCHCKIKIPGTESISIQRGSATSSGRIGMLFFKGNKRTRILPFW